MDLRAKSRYIFNSYTLLTSCILLEYIIVNAI